MLPNQVWPTRPLRSTNIRSPNDISPPIEVPYDAATVVRNECNHCNDTAVELDLARPCLSGEVEVGGTRSDAIPFNEGLVPLPTRSAAQCWARGINNWAKWVTAQHRSASRLNEKKTVLRLIAIPFNFQAKRHGRRGATLFRTTPRFIWELGFVQFSFNHRLHVDELVTHQVQQDRRGDKNRTIGTYDDANRQ